MYYFGFDPQTAPSHPCFRCKREIYGDYDICQHCTDRENGDEIEWGD